MRKLILLSAITLLIASCNYQNCETCLTEESHPDTSSPKTGIVTKVMLDGHAETSQNFIIYFTDKNGVERNYSSKTLALPGDTITWY